MVCLSVLLSLCALAGAIPQVTTPEISALNDPAVTDAPGPDVSGADASGAAGLAGVSGVSGVVDPLATADISGAADVPLIPELATPTALNFTLLNNTLASPTRNRPVQLVATPQTSLRRPSIPRPSILRPSAVRPASSARPIVPTLFAAANPAACPAATPVMSTITTVLTVMNYEDRNCPPFTTRYDHPDPKLNCKFDIAQCGTPACTRTVRYKQECVSDPCCTNRQTIASYARCHIRCRQGCMTIWAAEPATCHTPAAVLKAARSTALGKGAVV